MGTYDTPSGHPISPPDDGFPESLLRDGVWSVMENEGVPEAVMNAVDSLLLDWEIEKVRVADEAAGE